MACHVITLSSHLIYLFVYEISVTVPNLFAHGPGLMFVLVCMIDEISQAADSESSGSITAIIVIAVVAALAVGGFLYFYFVIAPMNKTVVLFAQLAKSGIMQARTNGMGNRIPQNRQTHFFGGNRAQV